MGELQPLVPPRSSHNATNNPLYTGEHVTKQGDYEASDDSLCSSYRSATDNPPEMTTTHSAILVNDAKTKKVLMGRILLLTTSFLYGTLNVTLRLIYTLPDPPSASALSSIRGWLATLCFLPFLMGSRNNSIATNSSSMTESLDHQQQRSSWRSLWRTALELAVWNFGAQGLLNLGLLNVESARAAFLFQTSVVITPVLSVLFGNAVHSTVWIACAIALIGLMFLSSTSDGIGHFAVGDLLCLGGALSWSFYILRLSVCQGYNEIHLQATKNFLLAILYSIWFGAEKSFSGLDQWLGYSNVIAWMLLFYSALGPGTIADVIQNKGQLAVTAAESNVILSIEPVFTSLLGLLLLGEGLTWQEIVGGGLILTAAVLATW